jgi:hypothetical protein
MVLIKPFSAMASLAFGFQAICRQIGLPPLMPPYVLLGEAGRDWEFARGGEAGLDDLHYLGCDGSDHIACHMMFWYVEDRPLPLLFRQG